MDLVLALAGNGQGGHEHAPTAEAILVASAIAALFAALLLIAWLIRRPQRRAPTVTNEWQARAVMGELCPGGWQAQITAYGGGAPLPIDAPPSSAPLVELEWRQFDVELGDGAVAHHLWAPSIEAALQAMVDHQRTGGLIDQS